MFGDEFADFLLRIIQITKDPGSGRTDLDTSGIEACLDSVMTEVAFLDDRNQGVNIPRIVRTGGKAVFATDASVLVNHNDPIFPLPSRLNRAVDHTRGVITLIAEVGKKVTGDIGILSFFNNLYPGAIDSYGNAVFCLTGDRTGMATDAPPEIDHHPIPFLFDLAFLHLFSAPVYFLQKGLSIGEFIYI
jgi:hypothetical protein